MQARVSRSASVKPAAKTSRSPAACAWECRRTSRSSMTMKSHGWVSPTLGAACAADRSLSRISAGMTAPVYSRGTSRRRLIASCKSMCKERDASWTGERCCSYACGAPPGLAEPGRRSLRSSRQAASAHVTRCIKSDVTAFSCRMSHRGRSPCPLVPDRRARVRIPPNASGSDHAADLQL